MPAMARTATTAINPPVSVAGDVTITGGLHPEDEPLERCRISLIGDRAVLSVWDDGRGRFVAVDAITAVTVTAPAPRTLIYSGISEQLTGEGGLDADNATVQWRVARKACATC